MGTIRETTWAIVISIVGTSFFWFFRDNPHTLWAKLLRDPSLLALGFIPILYAIFCALHGWIGPRLAARRNRHLVAKEAQNDYERARLAAWEAELSSREAALQGQTLDHALGHVDSPIPPPETISSPGAPQSAQCRLDLWHDGKLLALGVVIGLWSVTAYLFIMAQQAFPELSCYSYVSAMMAYGVRSGVLVTGVLVLGAALAWQLLRLELGHIDVQEQASQTATDQEFKTRNQVHESELPAEVEPSFDLFDLDNLKNPQEKVLFLEDKILQIMIERREMKKRDLERMTNKSYYRDLWGTAILNLVANGRLVFNADTKTYSVCRRHS